MSYNYQLRINNYSIYKIILFIKISFGSHKIQKIFKGKYFNLKQKLEPIDIIVYTPVFLRAIDLFTFDQSILETLKALASLLRIKGRP